MLVGGAHNGERKDLLMLYEFAGLNLKDRFAPVWERAPKGGLALGSLGAFLVIEEHAHAQARGAKPLARLTAVSSDRSGRRARRSNRRVARDVEQAAAGVRTARRSFPARPVRNLRPRKSAHSSPSTRMFRRAPPAAISGMGSNRSSR